MKKKEHKHQKQTAVRDRLIQDYEKRLARMSDEDFQALALAIPPKHVLFPVVYQEHKKRSRRRWQELMDEAPSDEMRAMAQDLLKPETFERFLRETDSAERFEQLCQGDEERFEQMMSGLSEQAGQVN